ncbi:hypothetical protein E2C01_073105 [Portunus trituberculatus]|uniref:Uncharacterized protein n=1 Tax=Portunus trituberculatus TaxID=210409 RepID=A0A5B7I8K2_PORTR|nr:hypothetical protein [Portunus trituberculatus]
MPNALLRLRTPPPPLGKRWKCRFYYTRDVGKRDVQVCDLQRLPPETGGRGHTIRSLCCKLRQTVANSIHCSFGRVTYLMPPLRRPNPSDRTADWHGRPNSVR